jgi:hypothetical protein
MSRRGKRLFSIELHELDAIAKDRVLSGEENARIGNDYSFGRNELETEIEGRLVEGGRQEYKIL